MVPTIGTFKCGDAEVTFTEHDYAASHRPWFDLDGFQVHEGSFVTDEEIVLIMYKTFYEDLEYGETPPYIYFEMKLSRKTDHLEFKLYPENNGYIYGHLMMKNASYQFDHDYAKRIQTVIDDGVYYTDNPKHWHAIGELCDLCEGLQTYIEKSGREADLFVANF